MKFKNIKLPSNRKFGYFFTFIFFLIGFYFGYNENFNFSFLFFAFALIFLIITFFKSDLLYPLNKAWMRIGILLGIVVSPIVLGLIFFGIFTPISILMKIFKRDELRIKSMPMKTYWKKRTMDNNLNQTSFKYQF